jgi:hypothetical protein
VVIPYYPKGHEILGLSQNLKDGGERMDSGIKPPLREDRPE